MARPGLVTHYNWLRVKSPYKIHLTGVGYAQLSARFGGNLLVWTRCSDVMQLMIRGAHVKFHIISDSVVRAGIAGEVQEVSGLSELQLLYYKFLEDNWQT